MTIPTCFGQFNKLTPNGQAEYDCFTCLVHSRCSAIPRLPAIRVEPEGEANFYRLMDNRTGEWVASLQMNGALTVHKQKEILELMAVSYNIAIFKRQPELREPL